MFWHDDCCFNDNEIKVLNNFRDKLRYLFATFNNDTLVLQVLQEILLEITEVKLPAVRKSSCGDIVNWFEQYNISIKDFLVDSKYIVISGDCSYELEQLSDLGLINWDAIKDSSMAES